MHSFALDLKVQRRKAGLSQKDCAHLLGVHPSRISLLESGHAIPKVAELFTLSVIYGKALGTFFTDAFEDVRELLQERLTTLPRRYQFNRRNTLSQLAERLEAKLSPYGPGA